MPVRLSKYTARELVQMSPRQLWDIPRGIVEITYDDGTVEYHTSRRTIFIVYGWFLARLYPEIPILPGDHFGQNNLTKMTLFNVCSKVLERWYDRYPDAPTAEIERVWELVYLMSNEVNNTFSKNLDEYVTSINAIDIAGVLSHPRIHELNEVIRKQRVLTDRDIIDCINACKKVLLTDPDLDHNEFAISVRSGVVNLDQALQVISPIGNRSDVDSRMFAEPIRNGVGHGLTTLYESMLESRAAARATVFHEEALRSSETSNRLTQLVCAAIANLHRGDCGSRDYLEFTLSEKRHLRDFAGQYYLDPQTKSLKALKATDTHLLHQTIPFRNVLTCQTSDRYGVCERCYGQLSRSIPEGSNLGHGSPTVLIGFLSQLILSTKHLDRNAAAEILQLGEEASLYFGMSDDGRRIRLGPRFVNGNNQLLIPIEAVPEINNLRYLEDTRSICLERFSSVDHVLLIEGKGVTASAAQGIPLSQTARLSLTREFLEYMKTRGWTIQDKYLCVELDEWDAKQHVMVLPILQFSSPEFMKQVTAFLSGTKATKKSGKKSSLQYASIAKMIMEFNDMVAMKLQVNIVHLSMIILAHKVERSMHKGFPEDRDVRPPLPKVAGAIGSQSDLLVHRSVATTWASMSQAEPVLDWSFYMAEHQPPHYQDWLFVKNPDAFRPPPWAKR